MEIKGIKVAYFFYPVTFAGSITQIGLLSPKAGHSRGQKSGLVAKDFQQIESSGAGGSEQEEGEFWSPTSTFIILYSIFNIRAKCARSRSSSRWLSGGRAVGKKDLVAQLVEQYTFNEWVLGSNPSGVTEKNKCQPSKLAICFWLGTKKPAPTIDLFQYEASDNSFTPNFLQDFIDLSGNPSGVTFRESSQTKTTQN